MVRKVENSELLTQLDERLRKLEEEVSHIKKTFLAPLERKSSKVPAASFLGFYIPSDISPDEPLPQMAFYTPILLTLLEKGGEVETKELMQGVLEKIRPYMCKADFDLYFPKGSKNGLPYWVLRVYLCKAALARRGYLSKDAPRGVWKLSPFGRLQAQALKKIAGGSGVYPKQENLLLQRKGAEKKMSKLKKASDKKTNDKKASDKKANDKKANDKKANDKKANDKKANDKKANDKKANDKKANDKKANDKKANDKKANDKKANDKKANDN